MVEFQVRVSVTPEATGRRMKQQAQTTNATIEKHTDSNQMEGRLQLESRETQVKVSNTVQVHIDEITLLLYCSEELPPRWDTGGSRKHLRNMQTHLRRELKDSSLLLFQSKHMGKIQLEIKEELLPSFHDILNKNKERSNRQLVEVKACGMKAQPAEVKQETPSEEVQNQHLQQIQSSDYVRNLNDSNQLQTHRCHELQHQLQCMNAERERLALDLQQERSKNTELEIMDHDLLALADERNKTMEVMEAQLDEAEKYRALCEAQLQEQTEAAKILKAALEEQKQELRTAKGALEEESLQHVESSEQLEEAERSRALCEAQFEEQKEELRAINAALEEQKQEVGTIKAALEEEVLQHVESSGKLEEAERSRALCEAQFEEQKEDLGAIKAALEEQKQEAETLKVALEEEALQQVESSEKLEEAERSRALCEAQFEEQKEDLGAFKAALEEQKQEAETLKAAIEEEALKREEEKSSLLQWKSLRNTLLKKEKEWEKMERVLEFWLEDLKYQIQQQQQQQQQQQRYKWYTRLFRFLSRSH